MTLHNYISRLYRWSNLPWPTITYAGYKWLIRDMYRIQKYIILNYPANRYISDTYRADTRLSICIGWKRYVSDTNKRRYISRYIVEFTSLNCRLYTKLSSERPRKDTYLLHIDIVLSAQVYDTNPIHIELVIAYRYVSDLNYINRIELLQDYRYESRVAPTK